MYHLSKFASSALIFIGYLTMATSLASPTKAPATNAAPSFAKVSMSPLPVVYVYDHCPFCVRVRLALGVKNVKHTVHFLANDDVETPTNLVGKKIAPIFQFKQDDLVMGESMDIIQKIDADERFGPVGSIKEATGRTDLKEWQKSVQVLLRTLQRPRYVATGLLPEFQQVDGRHAFIKGHQLPPFEKKEWKEGDMSMDKKLELYAEAMAKDPREAVEELNKKLIELDELIHCEVRTAAHDFGVWVRLQP